MLEPKKGLSYFPLDTDFMRDQKIQRLLLEFGFEGLCVFMAVLCEVYASQGYYAVAKGNFYSDIGFMLGINGENVKKIILYAIELTLFDKKLYEERKMLTSYGIQQRFDVISKRSNTHIHPTHRIIREEDSDETELKSSRAINGINGNENGNENGNGNRNENRNENKTKHENEKRKPTPANNDDETRRAELLRMAAAATATTGRRDV